MEIQGLLVGRIEAWIYVEYLDTNRNDHESVLTAVAWQIMPDFSDQRVFLAINLMANLQIPLF